MDTERSFAEFKGSADTAFNFQFCNVTTKRMGRCEYFNQSAVSALVAPKKS
jgi:hypothetical protein